MPPWEKTGTPGDVALAHFHSSTMSGSASWMIRRTFASVFPRQSPSSAILSSILFEAGADSGVDDDVFFMVLSLPRQRSATYGVRDDRIVPPRNVRRCADVQSVGSPWSPSCR